MICKFCNAENPDGAAFCSACGKRIDGKIVCPKCGSANNENAVYCYICGERIDGKRACPECGEVLPDGARFCPVCGHSSGQIIAESAQTVAKTNAPLSHSQYDADPHEETLCGSEYGHLSQVPSIPQTTVKPNKSLSHWLNLSGGIALLASATFALIFIFCLGLTSVVSSSELLGSSRSQTIIYDFFSKIYEQISLSLQDITTGGEYLAFPLYFSAAIGTLIAAGSLVSIPVCVVLAAVRFARSVRGTKGNTDYFAPAAAAYAVFLCSACVLLALYAGHSTGTESSTSVTMNDASLAGVILGGIFFGAGCGLRIVAKGKSLLTRNMIKNGIVAAVGSVFSIIILSFATQGALGVSSTGAAANIMSYMSLAGMGYISKIQAATTGTFVAAPSNALAASVFAVIFQLAVIALTVCLLILLWKSLAEERAPSAVPREKNRLIAAAFLLACAVGALAASILFGDFFVKYMELDSAVKLTYTAPIVTLVFSVLLFTAVIVDAVLLLRPNEREIPHTDQEQIEGDDPDL